MKTFTIENETNNITAHATAEEAKSIAGAERFATADAWAGLAAGWPSARLVEIWNTLPGTTPVNKFKDRATAVSRIWARIQSLGDEAPVEATPLPELVADTASVTPEGAPRADAASATPVAPPTPDVAPQDVPAKTRATRVRKSPVAATKKGLREGSKTEAILALIKRPDGASLKEIIEATNWQAHSVRGFISGTLGKKMTLTVVSTRTSDGERIYSLKA
jgi:hypothetical protein